MSEVKRHSVEQFMIVEKRLEENDNTWSARWTEINKRLEEVEVRLVNSQPMEEREKFNTRLSTMEKSYA